MVVADMEVGATTVEGQLSEHHYSLQWSRYKINIGGPIHENGVGVWDGEHALSVEV